MGLPQLDNLVRIRQLKSELCTQAEIDGLMRSGYVAEYEGYLDIDRRLVEGLLLVAAEGASRVADLGVIKTAHRRADEFGPVRD